MSVHTLATVQEALTGLKVAGLAGSLYVEALLLRTLTAHETPAPRDTSDSQCVRVFARTAAQEPRLKGGAL
jgi:hypothetical protein